MTDTLGVQRVNQTSPSGTGVFTVPSATTPGLLYDVAYEGPGLGFCTCQGYQHRNDTSYACRHIKQVKAFIQAEAGLERLLVPAEDRATAAARLRAIAAVFDR